jgi:hypothetical protein
MIRKVISLPSSMWSAIADTRRIEPGKILSETKMVQRLLSEALSARSVNVTEGNRSPP